MKNEDLENTQPINALDTEEVMTRTAKNIDHQFTSETENLDSSREERYKDIEEETEVLDTEEAEEALAEKNIATAEALLEEEQKLEEQKLENKEKEKINLIEKFKKLPKKTRIIIIVVSVIVLILIIALSIFLITKKDKKTQEPNKNDNQSEKAPVVIDNYYYQNGVLHFLSDDEKEIGTYECINQDEKLCFVSYNKYRDDFNTDLLTDGANKENIGRMPIYNENYVFINDSELESNPNILLYSLKENAVEEKYREAKAYDDNYVIVRDLQDQYGLLEINDDIKELIEPKYEYLGMLDKEDNLVSKTAKGYTIINKKGKELSRAIPTNNQVKYYSNDLIVTLLGNDYNVYNYNGDLLESGNEFATVKEDYMALVKNGKLYIRNKNKEKLNETGINLKNKNYVRTYIYDENNHLTKTKMSFTMEIRDDDIEVTVYDSDSENPLYTRLELAAVELNSKYKYLNYFDSKLYFYQDEAKENLIGSYTCTNKNTVERGISGLDSCLPAKDTIFEDNETTTSAEKERKTTIPLINNRFVFIADGTKNINFYDLVDNKNLGTYEAVNTYLNDNNYEFSIYNGAVNYVALNKKGKYGMATIEGNKVTVKQTFMYNHLEKMNTHYLAQNEENKWLLIYNENSTSATFDQKIAEVNETRKYFKIGQNDKYLIYSNSGEKISPETYKKAKLYNNYYGAINSSNELSVYDYAGKKLTEGIKINDYTCNKPDLFRIELNGGRYKVSVCNKDEYEVYNPSFINESKEPTEDDKDDDKKDETEDKTETTPPKKEE